MLLPMTTMIELLLKKKKWFWVSPVLLFVLVFVSRISGVFFKDSVISYFSSIACVGVGGLILISILIVAVNYVFDTQNRWCEDISAFHSIGYGFYLQIFFKVVVIIFFVSVYAVIFMFISDSIASKIIIIYSPFGLLFYIFPSIRLMAWILCSILFASNFFACFIFLSCLYITKSCFCNARFYSCSLFLYFYVFYFVFTC